MSEQAAQEPTMEEILASIRRIISEDDAPAEGQAEAAAPEPAPEPAPEAEAAPEPAPQPEPESPAVVDEAPSVQAADVEVLELTEKVEEPAPVESIGDIDIAPRAEPAPPPPAPEPAFIAPTPQYQSAVTAATGGSLDEMVRTIIEAEIKAWLAQNLDQVMREITKEKFDRVFK